MADDLRSRAHRWRRQGHRLLGAPGKVVRTWGERRERNRVARVVARAPRRGRALVSYLASPSLGRLDRPLPLRHTQFWEAREIVLAFADLGYDVDAIHWQNTEFRPDGPYEVCLDVRINLERLAPLVGPDCLLIQHTETCHHSQYNAAQRARLEALHARRGVRLEPRRLIEVNRAIEVAHCATTVGNEFTIGTYAFAGKPMRRIPVSNAIPYPSPADKDFEAVRRRWLWFGSGGLVHKGLDVVLEAFAEMPDHELVVCGPVSQEPDFEAHYARELYGLPNIHTEGWVAVDSPRFQEIARSCLGLVYPSCSEGGGASAVTCLHAGLVPLATTEASLDLEDFGALLPAADPETVCQGVQRLSEQPAAQLRQRAVAGWEHARRHHSREEFARRMRATLADYLESGSAATA